MDSSNSSGANTTMTIVNNHNNNNFYMLTTNLPITQQSQFKYQNSLPLTTPPPAPPSQNPTKIILQKMQPIAPAPIPNTNQKSIPAPTSTDQNINSHGNKNINKIQTNQLLVPIDTIRGYTKKYTYANMPYGDLPQSVARRNARERNRVKQVNNGFATLRQHIPQTVVAALTNGGRGASKKLSKVDTLRMAVEYISRLQELISDSESDSETSSNYNSSGHSTTSSIGSPFFSTTNYNNNNESSVQTSMINQNYHNFTMRSPSYSEASLSPTPSSYNSDQSIGSTTMTAAPTTPNQYYNIQSATNTILINQQQQSHLKYEPYDTYGSITDTTPEDEELLDYISSWQEQ